MKKRKQFLYFLAILALILTLLPVEIPSMAQAGTSIGTPSDAEEELPEESISVEILPEETIPNETLPEETTPEQTTPDETTLEEAPTEETTPDETRQTETEKPKETEAVPSAPLDYPSETESSASVSMPFVQIQSPSMASARIATGSDAEPREIVKVMIKNSDVLILAERQNARELLKDKLDNSDYSIATVLFSDRTREFYPIQYDVDALDVTQTGLIYLNGTVEVPDDVSIDPELTAATLPVFLYDPEAPCELQARSSDPVRDSQLLLAQDSSFEELQNELKGNRITYLYFDDGISMKISLTWDVSSVIFGTPGTYRIHGIPDLPEGILLGDEFPSLSCDVIIQKAGVFSLTPPTFDGMFFQTRWTKPTPQLDKLRRYYAIGDEGAWQEDTTGKFMEIRDSDTQLMYVFYFDDFLLGVPYYFQLEYDGECSNILMVCITEDDVDYKLFEGDRDGGDRGEQPPPTVTLPPDQSDDTPPLGTTRPEGNTPPETPPEETLPAETVPAETQPTDQENTSHNGSSSGTSSKPSRHSAASDFTSGPGYQESLTVPASLSLLPEAEPSVGALEEQTAESSEAAVIAAASPVPTETAETNAAISSPASTGQEADTADYTILSGRRIQKELELNPGRPVVITKHRIRLEIPADTGLFSSMSEQSLFRSEVMSLADNRISVMLTMDGVPLTDLPSITITMPWEAADERPVLEVTNENGEVLGTATYLDSSTITFQLSESGAFTIAPQTSAAAPAAVTPSDQDATVDGQTSDSVSANSFSVGLVAFVLLAGILASGFIVLRVRRRGRRDQK